MSDNPDDATPVVDADTPAPADAPAVTTTADASTDGATESASDAKADEPAKQSQGDRRFAILTAKKAEADRRADEAEQRAQDAEKRAAAAEALLNPDAKPAAPDRRPMSQDDVRKAARELIAEQQFNERRGALILAGTKEFGADEWNAKTGIVATLGAFEAPGFMQAIVELDDGHKVVAALAEDVDAMERILALPPVAMAAKLGRMSAELAAPPRPKALSAAPAPVGSVTGRAQATPDIYNTASMTEAEWMALRTKTAPKHLGGQGKGR